MNLAVLATVFGVVFVAELPDKTALASLVLGTRYRPIFVFAGVAAAFVVHVVLAVSAGSLLFLLPHRVMQAAVAVLFAAGAVLMLRRRDDDVAEPDAGQLTGEPDRPGEDRAPGDRGDGGPRGGVATLVRPAARIVTHDGFWRVAWRSFAVLFVAEFGDLTQLVTANLSARYHDPLAVGAGAVLGLWAVGGLAIVGGRQLLRVVPFRWITRIAAVVMAGLAVASLIAAITG
ncbi:MAG TPA: TMEM165/GDT1 family protein [Streptosporangiaceae bacterium]|jgi:putative Ca2+/H+ antiporter (TMEM165/GDT1 family)|nr:TMEM165/GDT1 family protein [Streptosporangiaceae bacterium]